MAREILAHPNIVALRSMSKEYSLAGERFGITIAHPEVISVLGRMLPPYPLSQTAIRAVSAVMTPEGLAYARDKITRIIRSGSALPMCCADHALCSMCFPATRISSWCR